MTYHMGTKVGENTAHAVGLNLSISTKNAVEVCNQLRGKNLQDAKMLLEQVILKKQAIPMKRFNDSTGHRKCMGPGKYPVKTSYNILRLLISAEANALNKGLNTNFLVIQHIKANLASRPWHYGRLRRRKMKRTHVELILMEQKQEKRKND